MKSVIFLVAVAGLVAVFSGLPARALAAEHFSVPENAAAAEQVPEIPECEGVLTPELYQRLKLESESAHEEAERVRATSAAGLMVSPRENCQSKAWLVAHGKIDVPRIAGATGLQKREPANDDAAEFPAAPKSLSANIPLPWTGSSATGGMDEYQGETSIAIDPANPNALIAGSNSYKKDTTLNSPCRWNGNDTANPTRPLALYASSDGGTTWTYRCAPWPTTLTATAPGADEWFGTDPSVVWGPGSVAYAVYMVASRCSTCALISSVSSAVVISRSLDGGQTWQSLGTVYSTLGQTDVFQDKPMVAVDTTNGPHRGRLYVIWGEGNLSRPRFSQYLSYSDDGATWSQRKLLETNTGPGDPAAWGGTWSGSLAVSGDGTLFASWSRIIRPNSDGGNALVMVRSTDGGATFSSPPVQIAKQNRMSYETYSPRPPAQDLRPVTSYGVLGAFGSRLYLVYADNAADVLNQGAGFKNMNIYFRYSTDQGATWTPAADQPGRQLNVCSEGQRFNPWLAVDNSGNIHVVWYDASAMDTNLGGTQTRMVYTRSTDGGLSFSPNQKLTDVGANFHFGVPDYSDESSIYNPGVPRSLGQTLNINENQYGDYMGLAAANGRAVALWTDSRQFFPSSSGDNRREDVVAASVMTTGDVPSATVSDAASPPACGAADGLVRVDLSGPGPWTLRWSDGLVQSNVTSTPVFRNVTVDRRSRFSIADVANANGSGISCGSVTVGVVPSAKISAVSGYSAYSVYSVSDAEPDGTTYSWTVTGATLVTQPDKPAIRIQDKSPIVCTSIAATVAKNGCGSASDLMAYCPSPPRLVDDAAFVAQTIPRNIGMAVVQVSIRMRNTGTTTWPSKNAATTTHYWLQSENPTGNGYWFVTKVPVPVDVPPGATATFAFTVRLPYPPGVYNFQWRMMKDGTGPFGQFTPNLSVDVPQ